MNFLSCTFIWVTLYFIYMPNIYDHQSYNLGWGGHKLHLSGKEIFLRREIPNEPCNHKLGDVPLSHPFNLSVLIDLPKIIPATQ